MTGTKPGGPPACRSRHRSASSRPDRRRTFLRPKRARVAGSHDPHRGRGRRARRRRRALRQHRGRSPTLRPRPQCRRRQDGPGPADTPATRFGHRVRSRSATLPTSVTTSRPRPSTVIRRPSWQTEHYQDPHFGRLKTRRRSVSSRSPSRPMSSRLTVTSPTAGWTGRGLRGRRRPSVERSTAGASRSTTTMASRPATTTFDLHGKKAGAVLIWITHLGPDGRDQDRRRQGHRRRRDVTARSRLAAAAPELARAMTDDAGLVEAAQRGDREALDHLLRAHQPADLRRLPADRRQ